MPEVKLREVSFGPGGCEPVDGGSLDRRASVTLLTLRLRNYFPVDAARRRKLRLSHFHPKLLILSLLLLLGCGTFCFALSVLPEGSLASDARRLVQESFPAPPADRAQVYVLGEGNKLVALPFETGTTPLSIEKSATSDKRSYIELKGESAATMLKTNEPRLYLFVPDVGNAHPPFLVRLTPKRGVRRVTAMAQRGFKGFAIYSEEIVKPHYRVLGRDAGMLFMEIRPREPLLPGEYAVIGTDLGRVATFRIGAGGR